MSICLEFKGGIYPMAIVVVQEFAGGTLAQYDRVTEQLNLGGYSPEGNLFHIASLEEGGLRVIDVWESESALNAFMGVLGPVAHSAGIPEPRVTVSPVHNILRPRG
jgi:hypothetical protein